MNPFIQVCAWCGRRKSGGGRGGTNRVSHGICQACALELGGDPVEDLGRLSPEAFDALPWGTMQLDDQGVVRIYNTAEADLARRSPQSVLGHHFFREVAPCTAVHAFEGRFDEMVSERDPSRREFQFLFRFEHGPVRVRVVMVRDPSIARTVVLVQPLDPLT